MPPQSRSSSLIAVFARVWASTRLTMTAQASEGPGEPSGRFFPGIVPGAMPGKDLPDGSPGPSLACAVIVKRVDAQTRAKTGINELLRD